MRTILLFILFFVLFAVTACMQNASAQSNDLDKQYTPDKNSVFNNKSSASSGKGEEDISDINNAFKFNIGLLIRSTAAFFWERKISSGITIQPGLGVCYSKDKLMGILGEDFNITPSTSSVPLASLIAQGTSTGTNLFLSCAFRFYFSNYYGNEIFQSGYFEMNGRYSPMELKIYSNMNSTSSNYNSYKIADDPRINLHIFSFYTIYGYQFCTAGKIKTTHDFYCGVGIRSIGFDAFQSTTRNVYDQYGNLTQETVHVKSGARESALLPSFVLGYAFGFGF